MEAHPEEYSSIQKSRMTYIPPLPSCFSSGPARYVKTQGKPLDAHLSSWFPKTLSSNTVNFLSGTSGQGEAIPSKPIKVGIVFCGRQCPGGHNVVAGVLDALNQWAPGSVLLGFVGGTLGLFEGKTITLNNANVAPYRNQVGWVNGC